MAKSINWYSKNVRMVRNSACGYPNVTVRDTSTKGNVVGCIITFYECAHIHGNKGYCKVALMDNRIYFMFTDKESIESWKCQYNTKGKRIPVIKVSYHDDVDRLRFSKFVRNSSYKLSYDSEYELYYIELDS